MISRASNASSISSVSPLVVPPSTCYTNYKSYVNKEDKICQNYIKNIEHGLIVNN